MAARCLLTMGGDRLSYESFLISENGMNVASASRIESSLAVSEPVIAVSKEQAFQAGTRTGDWFAIGDVHPEILPPPSLPPASLSPALAFSSPRRSFVRLVGFVAIAGTLACLLLLATR